MSALQWFCLLLGVCIAGPYVLRVPPRTKCDWRAIGTTIVFLIWILGMSRLVSR